MAQKEISFDRDGLALSAEVKLGFAQEGAYILTLWSGNQITERWEGNFLNSDDDAYDLSGNAADYDGRILQARFEIGIVPPIDQYAATLVLTQGEQVLDTIEEQGNANGQTFVGVNLFAILKTQ
jgi:hypothetical protein